MESYHSVLCEKDFSWLQEEASELRHNGSAMRSLLALRFLAVCVKRGASGHPLDHPVVARLQAQTHNDHFDVFTLTQSIIQPIRILCQLGIDVFSNLRFDTWVLHTIWTRLANNKQGFSLAAGYIDSVNPLLSFFNHSCEPNVEYRNEGSTTVKFLALRNISKGEELFDSYRNVQGLDLAERTEMLWPWFEGPCRCNKCISERGYWSYAI